MIVDPKPFRIVILLVAVPFLMLTIPSPTNGQANDQRLDAAFAEIVLLKRVVAEQDRRIADLEAALKKLQIPETTGTIRQAPSRQATVQAGPSAPWKTAANWGRIRDGMSQAQVVSILGQPTSVEDTGPYRTLFYRGDVPGYGSVSGNVKITDDRVWLINKPVF